MGAILATRIIDTSGHDSANQGLVGAKKDDVDMDVDENSATGVMVKRQPFTWTPPLVAVPKNHTVMEATADATKEE